MLLLRQLAALYAFAVAIYISVPYLLKAGRYRPAVETTIGKALGREVRVGSLAFTIGLGGLVATDVVVAQNPALGTEPFLRVPRLKLGINRSALLFGGRIEIADVDLTEPSITAVRDAAGRWSFTSMLIPGTVAPGPGPHVRVRNGVVTVRGGPGEAPIRLRRVQADFPAFSTVVETSFRVTAAVDGGGSVALNGRAGPVLWNHGAPSLPMSILVNARTLALAGSHLTSGVAPAVDGALNFDGTVESDGSRVTLTGNAQIAKLRLAKQAEPAADPVQFGLTAQHDLTTGSGEIRRCEVRLGKGSLDVTGHYDVVDGRASAKAAIDAHGVPAANLGSLLAAAGIPLPSGSSLQEGVAFLDLRIEGPVTGPSVAGIVTLDNAKLTGFDLEERLQSVSGLDALQIRRDLSIDSFTASLKRAPAGIEIDHVELTIPGIGALTGAGTISADRKLDFRMDAIRTGVGDKRPVPFVVRGACDSPVFRQPGKTL